MGKLIIKTAQKIAKLTEYDPITDQNIRYNVIKVKEKHKDTNTYNMYLVKKGNSIKNTKNYIIPMHFPDINIDTYFAEKYLKQEETNHKRRNRK